MEADSRILVVDDSRANRETLADMLGALGHACREAADGESGLRLAADADLVLLDLIMPGLDGIAVLERLKADPVTRHLPVIMLSGLSETETMARCIELGADDYLSRPYDPVLLQARLGACLQKKRFHDREQALFRELEANYRRLRELEALRDSLVHMVVHDLRTPLTGLLAGLQSLEPLGPLNDGQREMLALAEQSGEALLGLINDMLDVSRMEAGAVAPEPEVLDCRGAAEAALRQVAPLARDKRLELRREWPEDLGPVRADEAKLVRVLVNLLGNAVKFTPAGGSVTLSARAEPGAVRFSIRDTGDGIPEEARERIFEKFGQVENRQSRKVVSTGLGLTFCKLAVEAQGGRIGVESQVGHGSEFWFTLPR